MDYQNERELNILYKIVEDINPNNIIEIGSMFGDSLHQWFTLKPEKLVSIDMIVSPLDSRYFKQAYGHDVLWKEWAKECGVDFICLNKNSQDINTLITVRDFMSTVDFLFIDGDHSYGGVERDYMLYGTLVRSGGIIAFHDIIPNPNHGEIQVPGFWNTVKVGKQYMEFSFADKEFGIGVLFV